MVETPPLSQDGVVFESAWSLNRRFVKRCVDILISVLLLVQRFRVQVVGQLLGTLEVTDFEEGILHQGVGDPQIGHDLLYPLLLPEFLLPDELNIEAHLGGHPLGTFSDLVPERLGELRVVKDSAPALPQLTSHRLSVVDLRQQSGNQ